MKDPETISELGREVVNLRAQLAEAVARVKGIQADLIALKLYQPMTPDKVMRVTSLIESNKVFLARVDGAR